MKKSELFPLMYSSCLLIKGFSRSLILDLNRNRLNLIPNTLYTLIKEYFGTHSLSQLKYIFSDDIDVFNEYLSFLEQNEYVFYCSEVEIKRFPEISLKWDYPALVSHSIVDIKDIQSYNIID
jgi:hypothetical protein